jgi:hypothetical protein
VESGTPLSWRQEADMAPKPDRLTFVFGMVLAMAVTILAITTSAAPRIVRAIRLRRSRRFTGFRICTKGYRCILPHGQARVYFGIQITS